MTTIEIYERVPYDRNYHRYVCKWDDNVWYFTSTILYNHVFHTPTLEQSIKNYSRLVDTKVINKNPENIQDLWNTLCIHMPELFI